MGKVREIPLSEFGLVTCEQAAEVKGCDPATVRRWVSEGHIPAAVVGAGRSAKYLVRLADVKAYTPPPRGRQPQAKAKPTRKGRKKPPG